MEVEATYPKNHFISNLQFSNRSILSIRLNLLTVNLLTLYTQQIDNYLHQRIVIFEY